MITINSSFVNCSGNCIGVTNVTLGSPWESANGHIRLRALLRFRLGGWVVGADEDRWEALSGLGQVINPDTRTPMRFAAGPSRPLAAWLHRGAGKGSFQAAFTLVEAMISVAITGITMAALYSGFATCLLIERHTDHYPRLCGYPVHHARRAPAIGATPAASGSTFGGLDKECTWNSATPVDNQTGKAASFAIYGTSGMTAFHLMPSTGGTFIGTVYAPNAQLEMGSGGKNYTLIGGVVGGSLVHFNGGWRIHYDEALNGIGPKSAGTGLVVAPWREN
jgi:hypothetical protein